MFNIFGKNESTVYSSLYAHILVNIAKQVLFSSDKQMKKFNIRILNGEAIHHWSASNSILNKTFVRSLLDL